MMNRLFPLLIICLFLGACATDSGTESTPSSSTQTEDTGPHKKVDAETFAKLLSEQRGAQIIDIRRPTEFKHGYVPGARLIDYYDDDFKDKINKLDKEKPVFLYCQGGGRSHKAAVNMARNSFKEIIELEGGYTEWLVYKSNKEKEKGMK